MARHPNLGQVLGERKDGADDVRRVDPLRGAPRVVVVQPANRGREVVRRRDRVQLVRRADHGRAVRTSERARDHRAEQLGALGEVQREQRAADRVEHRVPSRLHRVLAVDLVPNDVVRDVQQQLVRACERFRKSRGGGQSETRRADASRRRPRFSDGTRCRPREGAMRPSRWGLGGGRGREARGFTRETYRSPPSRHTREDPRPPRCARRCARRAIRRPEEERLETRERLRRSSGCRGARFL